MKTAIRLFAVVSLLAIVIVILVPGYADYSHRAKLALALSVASASREKLSELCAASKLSAGIGLADLKIPEFDYAVVEKAELTTRDARQARLRIVLREIKRYGLWGLFPVTAIPSGAEMVFSGTCAEQKFDWKLQSTTIERGLLPPGLQSAGR